MDIIENKDVEELHKIVEEWWKSCYIQAKGNIIDMFLYACGRLPLDVGQTVRLHCKEKVFTVTREEDF